MITLRNSFHNTSIRLRANVGDTLTTSQMRRVRDTLCPNHKSGCVCGNVHGPQEADDGTRISTEEVPVSVPAACGWGFDLQWNLELVAL